MFAVDVCDLPATGGSTFVLIAGLFVLVAGVIVARWVRTSAGRLSVVVAPLVLLGGLVLAPQVADPCAPATITVPSATTTTTTIAVACANGGTCVVGAAGPGGGIIFYDAGSTQPWGRYLEAACAGWSDGTCGGDDTDPTAPWGCMPKFFGADGTAIGDGKQNTIDIVAGCVTSDITAAERAADLVLGGLDDWFLPSKDELNQMYTILYSVSPPLGGFSPDFYWSSSESGYFSAWLQYFSSGSQYEYPKDYETYVRPVRAF